MKLLVFCALIFGLESVFSQTVTIQPYYTSVENHSVIFTHKKTLALYCNVSLDGPLPDGQNLEVEWRKGDKLISEVGSLAGRFKVEHKDRNYSMTISEAFYDDAGTWKCSALIGGQEKAFSEINVATTIAVKIKAESINVVEEDPLKVQCSVLGSPFPDLSWEIRSETYNGTFDDGRVKIKNYVDENGKVVTNGELVIDKANKTDRGTYFCFGVNTYWAENTDSSSTMVRVKDKYAALWPFLGICAEVIVLCAVIIIYEKKRNKTELEESDTDQSPDQKNTPDHGKEANLRHRQ